MKLFGRLGKLWDIPQIIYLTLVLLSINYSTVAQKTDSQEPQPPKELERLEYFQGTWRCQQPATPAYPSSVFFWIVRRDLNNFWYLGNAQETRSSNSSKLIGSREFLGYNAASKKLIRSVVVGDGNSYNMTTSDWKDGKLVWEGILFRMGNYSTPLRQEVVRENQNRFTATYLIPDKEKRWKAAVNETCFRLSRGGNRAQ